jgi:acetyl-CoA acetyltransferase
MAPGLSYNIATAEQHEVALADAAAFHKRYMVTPIEVNPTGRRVVATVTTDEGVNPTSAEGLAKLKPVLPEGTITYGGQTYPADGNAGMIVTTREQARKLSRDPAIEIQLVAFAEGRAAQGYMPQANVPAVRRVLERVGLSSLKGGVKAIKPHNPFAINDCCLSRELDLPLEGINNYGCLLVWGYPQGPTGIRLMLELIEELVLLGGGYGLFTGCAAGDTAAAAIVKVDVS